ncbi:MAG: hypothetical protein PHI12_01905 [Dehalococcoidales bacterium]|mgnify:CR=1 FL=1|nr:hypothetical protein [Dehalococcoidales bacterium]
MATKTTLSVTVEPELKAIAQEIARENNTTTSGLISRCLEELASRRKEKQMIDYYQTMAAEHEDFAQKSAGVIQSMASSWGD